MRKLIISALIIIALPAFGVISAQSGGLDPKGETRDRGETSMHEYSWSQWSPDYFTWNINGTIPISDNVSLNNLEEEVNCSGYTTRDPFYRVYWFRERIEENQRLRVFFIGFDTDTALLIHHEDGTWLCNNNYRLNALDPMLDIRLPRTGEYSIWILSPHPGDSVDGILYFTLADYDPSDYDPRLTNMFDYVGQGASPSGTRFVYVACKINENDAELSADVVVDSMQGYEQVRLKVRSGTNTWYSEPVRVLRSGSTSFDYSRNGEGPLELVINPTTAISIGSLDVELTVQIKPPSGNWSDATLPYFAECTGNSS